MLSAPAGVDSRSCGPRGFTLVETLTVLAIIALLAFVAVPAFQGFLQKSRKANCAGNLRTLYSAAMSWSADNNHHILIGHDMNGIFGPINRGWIMAIKPYLNQPQTGEVTEVFTSPGNPVRGVRSYAMNSELLARRPGVPTRIVPRTTYRIHQINQPSKLVIIGNSRSAASNWLNKTMSNDDIIAAIPDDWFGDGTANFLFLDGHVESIKREDLLKGGERHDIFHGAIPDHYLNATL
jgi:prepilin-type N-terminal cleavage/methylation domain-containing protein/prepilin-type processing-associated H-X9-DG protein